MVTKERPNFLSLILPCDVPYRAFVLLLPNLTRFKHYAYNVEHSFMTLSRNISFNISLSIGDNDMALCFLVCLERSIKLFKKCWMYHKH